MVNWRKLFRLDRKTSYVFGTTRDAKSSILERKLDRLLEKHFQSTTSVVPAKRKERKIHYHSASYSRRWW